MVLSIMSRYEKTTQKPHPQGYPVRPKTIGEHIKKRRMDLGMYQADVARQFKVSEDCVCYWENGRSHPHLKYFPLIIAFLGYYPFDHETTTFGGKIRRYKYEHGLSNRKFAQMIGVDAATVAKWERNERTPQYKIRDTVDLLLQSNAAHY
jgi:DNA-binding transcriptional regulator YiaG